MKRRILKNFGHWVMIVKENVSAYEREVLERPDVNTSAYMFTLVRSRILSEPVERMYIIGLDGRNHVVFMHEIARGGTHGCSVTARDILRVVLMGGASAFVLVHNHPSGDPTPSFEDVAMTKTVAEAADIVGVALVDHIVIGSMSEYKSMLDLGFLPG